MDSQDFSMDTDNQEAKLNVFYEKYITPEVGGDEFGDSVTYGDLWKYQDPDSVEYWSIVLIPNGSKLAVTTKHKNGQVELPVSLYEQIEDINPGPPGYVYITCITTEPGTEEYRFTYMMEPAKTPFSISAHLSSLVDSDYEKLIKDVEAHVDKNIYTTESGEQHPANILAPRLRKLLHGFELFKMKMEVSKQSMQPLSLRREMSSQGASQESRLYETPDTRKSGNKRRKITPSTSSRQTGATGSRVKQTRKSLLSDAVEPHNTGEHQYGIRTDRHSS